MKIDISHKGFELTEDISKYVDKKISKLSRLIGRSKRRTVHVEVRLKEELSKKKNKHSVEVIVKIPGVERLSSKISTDGLLAAIDIVEDKLSQQLRRQKGKRLHKRTQGFRFAKIRSRRRR